jgi:hypothetical protein
MKGFLLVLSLLFSCSIFGETTYISVDKLPVNKDNDMHFKFISDNEKYFNHESTQWNYSVSKAALVDGLKQAFDYFAKQDAGNLEINLLLGDVSSYLYNLHETAYGISAEKYYKKAMQLAPLDFRPYWFMGKYDALANDLIHSIEYFRMAQIRLPKSEPAAFWDQFASAASQAGMPSTSIYAMDKAKAILSRPCDFERTNGQLVRNRILEVNSSRTYANTELWSYTQGENVTFSSRPLGIKLNIEPDWELEISSFEKKKATFTMILPALTNDNGQEGKCTISILTKVAADEDDLRTFLNSMVNTTSEKMEIAYSDKYPNMISYELVDPTTNMEHGGNHQYLIGIRRKQPLYPGLNLEQPLPTSGEKGEAENAVPEIPKGRFAGTIFYAVMLDTTDDIFLTAKRTFWDVFVNQLFIE